MTEGFEPSFRYNFKSIKQFGFIQLSWMDKCQSNIYKATLYFSENAKSLFGYFYQYVKAAAETL